MIKVLKYLTFVFIFLFVFASRVSAQVVINEVSPYEEWVELFNVSNSDISLAQCVLSMGSASQVVHLIEGDIISALGYKVFKKSISPEWTRNWLNNGGDSVSFNCPNFTTESFSYDKDIGSGKTFGRSPDGVGDFAVLAQSTENFANPSPTPTPTPTPEPTSTPTPTPTPTHTPTPTSNPTVTPTKTPSTSLRTNSPTPTPTKSPTSKPSSSPLSTSSPEELVLGIQNSGSSPSASPEEEATSKKKFPVFPVILIITGFLFIAGAVFFFVKNNVKKSI